MPTSLSKPLIVPQYGSTANGGGIIQLYTPDPTTGAPTLDTPFTVNVTSILNNLFGAGKLANVNAVALHGNDLFFTNSSSNSQAVFELPNYLLNPTAAIANAFVVTLDGNQYVGLAFDAAGNLYTSEQSGSGNYQIVRYTPATTTPAAGARANDSYTAKTVIGTAGNNNSFFGDLTFDSKGNLWVADYQNSRVVVFDAANLGGINTWHAIDDAAGTLAVANTTAGLTGSTTALFSDPEGVAFDGAGGTGNLWVGNNNDGGAHAQIAFDSLVKITPALQTLILGTPNNTVLNGNQVLANNNVSIYNVPTNAGGAKPQFGGLAIDTTNGILYANEEVAGDVRAYTLSTIAATPNTAAGTQVAVATTNPGNGGIALVNTAIACFREGTRLDAEHGPIPVEALAPGMTLRTAAGALREITWIGHSRIDCRRHPRPQDVLPVRVAAGAIAEGQPRRDLWLSPDHSLHIDGHLVPVRHLLNGATITQAEPGDVDAVRYFHVELATHDILLAEGLPAESYLDTGNRGAFANGGTVAMAVPDFALRVWEAAGAAPLCTGGKRLTTIRRRLLARARQRGFTLQATPDLQLEVDGRIIAPIWSGSTAMFHLPAGASQARLLSRHFRPSDSVADGVDHRLLGVAVTAVCLDGQDLSLTDARLGAGWLPPEATLRWTDGAATLNCDGAGILTATLALVGRYWQSSAAAEAAAA